MTALGLDLFSGLGGWSDGLAAEGFQVLGVEINEDIARLYKHPCLIADVRNLSGKMFSTFDLIVGSPPCRDFTQLPDKGHAPWREPKNPKRGLTMVYAFLRIVEEAQPQFWLMENVKRLTEHLRTPKPVCRARLGKGMYRYLWGKFPPFLIPTDMTKEISNKAGKLRSWERARIPLPMSRALARAVLEKVTQK